MARMFHRGCRLPSGWRFEGARAERTRIRVVYCHDDGARVALIFEHPAVACRPDFVTGRLAGSLRVTAARPDLADLVAAVSSSVAAHEAAWRWCEPAADPVDVELCAMLAGIKPRIRMTVPAPELASALARYRSAGAAVATLEGCARVRGTDVAVLYAALEQGAADELRDLEAELFDLQARSPAAKSARRLVERAGALLGYPDCCVEAFCRRIEPIEGVADAYRSAVAAWVPEPYSRLNDTLMPLRSAYVSFEPCAYDCAAAARIADRVALALEALDARARLELDRELARAVAIHVGGMRAWVEVSPGDPPTITFAGAMPRALGAGISPPDRALAHALVGCRVGRSGRVEVQSGGRAVVVAFADRGDAGTLTGG